MEIVVAADDGSRTYQIAATRAGRRVEVANARGVVEVVEVTRTGQPVRTARFMASRVIALVEHPAGEESSATYPGGAEPGARKPTGEDPGAPEPPGRRGWPGAAS